MMKTYDITYSTDLRNKDITWANPFIKGKIKTFFVPSVRYGREIVELIQRMDIEYETVTIDRFWDLNRWGFGDFYDKRGGIWDFDIMYQNLENVLTSSEEFDVLVIPGINGWGYFTEKTRKAILSRVEQGAGLVLIHPFTGEGLDVPEELTMLSPLQSLHEEGFDDGGYPRIELDRLGNDRWFAEDHYITNGIPFDLFPYEEMGYYPYKATGQVIIQSASGLPIAAVKEYGKGRIVAFGYYSRDILPQHNEFTGMDDTFSSSARDMAKAFLEIKREGIGKLLLHNADRDDLGIAIHYSMPSIHGTNIKDVKTRFEKNRQGWLDVLEDMGYQYRFVSSQQIEAGHLTDRKYKVLIMPYSIALSSGEAEEIKRFAREGGTVIGDLQTGLMDQHCKEYDSGQLDDLFGIERLTTDAEAFYINGGFMTNKEFPYFNHYLEHIPGQEEIGPGVVMEEIGTRTTTGKAAYLDDFSRRVASVVVNEYEKGKGIYLNFSLDQYPTQRNAENGGRGTRQILKEIFGLTSVKKYASIYDGSGNEIEKGFETIYYTSGSAKYVCLLRDMDEQADINYDGLILDSKKAGNDEAMEVNVEFDGTYHIYDVRKKQYLGFDNKAKSFIKEGDTAIFALLPRTLDSITVNMPESVDQGSSLTVDIEIGSGEADRDYSSVLAVNLYDPDGEYNRYYSENVSTSDGRYTKLLHIPYNEKKGSWKLQVKDVATGVCTEKQFEVK